jgi:aspartate aminotransferase-like enzyme
LIKKKIFTPGPTQVHPDVLKAIISANVYHRGTEFRELYRRLLVKLKQIFLTEGNICVLSSSGTGAMETAVSNFCIPGSNALVINLGRFGQRWAEICRAYGISVTEIKKPYGSSVTPEDIPPDIISDIGTVFLTHTETSTATVTDIAKMSAFIKSNSDATIIVDAITSVGAIEFRMDEWKVDVAVSASQKGFMTQPGLSIIAFNERALKISEINPMPRFYFDIRKELKSQLEGLTRWTPAVGLFFGLDKACEIILEYGLENWWEKTSNSAKYFRDFCIRSGFKLFSESPSDSITAFSLPDGMKSSLLINALKTKHGIIVANGQAELKDKIVRISHMGDIDCSDTCDLCDVITQEFEIIINDNSAPDVIEKD